MMTQVKRYQGKQHQHDHKAEYKKQLVRNKKITLEPMTIEDAIDQAEQLIMISLFSDKKTHQSHLLYKRDDGDYGKIETELEVNEKDA